MKKMYLFFIGVLLMAMEINGLELRAFVPARPHSPVRWRPKSTGYLSPSWSPRNNAKLESYASRICPTNDIDVEFKGRNIVLEGWYRSDIQYLYNTITIDRNAPNEENELKYFTSTKI